MSSMAPLFSVIVPTCDRPVALAMCLEALAPLVQHCKDSYEVLVSDDGPRQLARDLVGVRFPFARWLAGPRRGPGANRNSAVKEAKGRWVAFTDDDCIPDPGWLQAFARATSSLAVRALEGRTFSNPPPVSPWDEAPVNLSGGLFWSCNICVDRSVFNRLGGFDENYPHAFDDVDLRTALHASGEKIEFVPDALVNHPARHAGLRGKIGHMGRFYSHVYYEQKWNHGGFFSVYLNLAAGVTRHWLWNPLRLGRAGLSLATLYAPAMTYLTVAYLPWYLRAQAALAKKGQRP